MKKVNFSYLLTALLFINTQLVAQVQIPQFIMPLWFEDAVGNKDTIWVGSDLTSSTFNINPQFGEMAITTAFDSVFEVRAVHASDDDWEMSKIIVEDTEQTPGSTCVLAASTRILIHSKYKPVKITWDVGKMEENSPCHFNTIITPNTMVYTVQEWYIMDSIYCLMSRPNIITDLSYMNGPRLGIRLHDIEVEGAGTSEIQVLFYSAFWDYSHCLSTLPSDELAIADAGLQIQPNPVRDYVQLRLPAYKEVRHLGLFDCTGRQLRDIVLRSDQQELPFPYPAGLYYLRMQLSNGQLVTKKIVK
jgi:hypothetical protein